jgi:hypothetical protein
MNSELNDHANLIEQARELLSPYLDDEVTPVERALVEGVLAESPELQSELDSLRQMVNLLHGLPSIPAPRPFTLSEADVGPVVVEKEPFWHNWFKPAMGAAAVLAAVVLVGVYLFNTNLTQPAQDEVQSIAQVTEISQAREEPDEPTQKQGAAAEMALESVESSQDDAAQSDAETAVEVPVAESQLVESEAVEEAAEEAADEADSFNAAADAVPDTDQADGEANGQRLSESGQADVNPGAMATPLPLPTGSPEAMLQAQEAPASEPQPAPVNPDESAVQSMPPSAAESTTDQALTTVVAAESAVSEEAVEEAQAADAAQSALPTATPPPAATAVAEELENAAATPTIDEPIVLVTEAPVAAQPLGRGGGGGGIGGGFDAGGNPAPVAESEAEAANPFATLALIIGAIFLVIVVILGLFSWNSPRKR